MPIAMSARCILEV